MSTSRARSGSLLPQLAAAQHTKSSPKKKKKKKKKQQKKKKSANRQEKPRIDRKEADAKDNNPTGQPPQQASASRTTSQAVAMLPALRVFQTPFPRPHLSVILSPEINPQEPFLHNLTEPWETGAATSSPVEVDSGVDVDLAALSADSVVSPPSASSDRSSAAGIDALAHKLSCLRWLTDEQSGDKEPNETDSSALQKYKEARRERYIKIAETRREYHRAEVNRREEERRKRRQALTQRSGFSLAQGPVTVSSHRVNLQIGHVHS